MPEVTATAVLMTRAEYAAHRGCTERAVYKAQKRGKVVVDEASGRIDAAASDASWPLAGHPPPPPLPLPLPSAPPPPFQASPGAPALRLEAPGHLMTVAEYAEHRRARGWSGGSVAAVHEALATGRIEAGEHYHHRLSRRVRMVDPAAADLAWVANTEGEAELPLGPGDAGKPGPRRSEARERLDHFKAERAAIELAKDTRQLVRVADLEGPLVEACIAWRRGVEALARDLAPALAACDGPRAIEKTLAGALGDLVDAWSSDVGAILAAD